MTLFQLLDMAETLAEENNLKQVFHRMCIDERLKYGIRESMTKTLKDLNLYNEFVMLTKE